MALSECEKLFILTIMALENTMPQPFLGDILTLRTPRRKPLDC